MNLSRREFLAGILLAGTGLSACRTVARPTATFAGAGVQALDLSRNEPAPLSYWLDQPATVAVTVFDALARPVRTLAPGRHAAGMQTSLWDGRDDRGRLVFDEAYTWTVSIDGGSTPALALADVTGGGTPVEVQERSLDRDGVIRYRLPQAARVRLRIGLRGGALLHTLLDWAPQPAGTHVIRWDGLDTDGLFDLLAHPDLAYSLAAFSLPVPTILVTGNPSPAGEPPWLDLPAATTMPTSRAEAHLHALHPRDGCREPRVAVSLPQAQQAAAGGAPAVHGVMPVQVDVAAQDVDLVQAFSFEVYVFVDAVFLVEMAGDALPFIYHWDTIDLNPGPHVLTVNLKTFDDHIGVQSIVVLVEG